MKLNMTHNERIQKLEDLSRNLELMAERRVVQGQSFAFFARHGHHQASKAKRKGHGKASEWGQDGRKPLKRANPPSAQVANMVEASKVNKHDCTKPKKVLVEYFWGTSLGCRYLGLTLIKFNYVMDTPPFNSMLYFIRLK